MSFLKNHFSISVIVLLIISLSSITFSQNKLNEGENSLFMILNEIEVNNPGPDVPNCEYVEIRGDEDANVSGTVYLIEVNGDGAQAGKVIYSINLTGRKFGSNGLITVTGPANASPISRKNLTTNILGVSGCGLRNYFLQGTTYIEDLSVSNSNGTVSFLLVKTSGSTIPASTDLDTNNDGVIDNLPADAVILDAVGWKDGDAGDFVYGGLNITPPNTMGAPDAATRNHSNKNPFDGTAWFSEDITGNNIDSINYDRPNPIAGYFIENITPGELNLKATAATATISGRVMNSTGRGLRFVTVMMNGNGLPEPIYATTNMFGRYQFQDIPVGESYVLQVFSKRYEFERSSMVISLDDNISDADFIGVDR